MADDKRPTTIGEVERYTEALRKLNAETDTFTSAQLANAEAIQKALDKSAEQRKFYQDAIQDARKKADDLNSRYVAGDITAENQRIGKLREFYRAKEKGYEQVKKQLEDLNKTNGEVEALEQKIAAGRVARAKEIKKEFKGVGDEVKQQSKILEDFIVGAGEAAVDATAAMLKTLARPSRRWLYLNLS